MKSYPTNARKDSKTFFRSANGGRSVNRLKFVPRGGIRF